MTYGNYSAGFESARALAGSAAYFRGSPYGGAGAYGAYAGYGGPYGLAPPFGAGGCPPQCAPPPCEPPPCDPCEEETLARVLQMNHCDKTRLNQALGHAKEDCKKTAALAATTANYRTATNTYVDKLTQIQAANASLASAITSANAEVQGKTLTLQALMGQSAQASSAIAAARSNMSGTTYGSDDNCGTTEYVPKYRPKRRCSTPGSDDDDDECRPPRRRRRPRYTSCDDDCEATTICVAPTSQCCTPPTYCVAAPTCTPHCPPYPPCPPGYVPAPGSGPAPQYVTPPPATYPAGPGCTTNGIAPTFLAEGGVPINAPVSAIAASAESLLAEASKKLSSANAQSRAAADLKVALQLKQYELCMAASQVAAATLYSKKLAKQALTAVDSSCVCKCDEDPCPGSCCVCVTPATTFDSCLEPCPKKCKEVPEKCIKRVEYRPPPPRIVIRDDCPSKCSDTTYRTRGTWEDEHAPGFYAVRGDKECKPTCRPATEYRRDRHPSPPPSRFYGVRADHDCPPTTKIYRARTPPSPCPRTTPRCPRPRDPPTCCLPPRDPSPCCPRATTYCPPRRDPPKCCPRPPTKTCPPSCCDSGNECCPEVKPPCCANPCTNSNGCCEADDYGAPCCERKSFHNVTAGSGVNCPNGPVLRFGAINVVRPASSTSAGAPNVVQLPFLLACNNGCSLTVTYKASPTDSPLVINAAFGQGFTGVPEGNGSSTTTLEAPPHSNGGAGTTVTFTGCNGQWEAIATGN